MVQGTVNGYGERCGNANLVSILPALQLKLGYECVPRERLRLLTETSHFVDELCNLTPDPDQAYVGRNAFAHKGGMHVAGVQADARTFEHLDPELVGNSRDVLISELSGKGSVLSRAEGAGIELDADAAPSGRGALKEREHRGYHYEAADASFELLLRREAGEYEPLFRLESFRVITEKRADGSVETEATIKIWVDDHRYVRTAEGNGPVNALDRALREAITDLHPHLADIELVNYKVRILDERPRHRRGHAGAARLVRRRDGVGNDRGLGEHHRGLVGGARGVARVRVPAAGHPPPAGPPRRSPRRRAPEQPIPLARPDLGARGGAGPGEVLRSGRLSLGPVLERFEREFAAWLGVDDAVAVSSGTAALHLGVRALGWGAGRRGADQPVQLRRLGQLPALRGGDPGLLRHRPGHARPRPGAARAAVGERTAGLLPVHIFGYPARDARSWRRLADERDLGMLEDACEALGAVDSEGARSARAAPWPPSPSTPTSSSPPGRGA